MEKDIKKALYENIMSSVAKEVKKALNESDELADKQARLKDLKREYSSLTSKIDDMWVEYTQKMVITTDLNARQEISNNFYKSLEPLKVAVRNKMKEIYNLNDEINELKQSSSQSEPSKKPNYSYDNNYEDEGSDGDEHKFRVIRYTDKQLKNYDSEDYSGKDYVRCFVFDANEQFLPDFTPDWLYDILNNIDYTEFQESIFEMGEKSYNYLINHPDCVEHRYASNAEAYGDGDEYDEDEYGDDDEDEEYNNENTNNTDGNNKFIMEVISKDYICNGEGYWDKDDWDDLVKDKQILCYIYDADETPIPDFSPDWLYEILEKYENIPGGYCSEDMESTFIVSKETYDALLKDPHCKKADDYTDCGYNYNNVENEYNNYDDDKIKEKLSNIILNPDFKVKAGGRFAPKGGKAKLDLLDENYEKDIYLHEMFQDDPKLAQVRKDIKYDVDFENVSLDHKGTTKSGIDYLALLVNGDWEEPVAVFVYWDGKKYRGYVPTRGNAINTINKSAFGNDEDADNEYCTKYLGLKDYYGGDGCAFGLPINWGACLEEFETRLVVK